MPRKTVALPPEAFGPSDTTTVHWLGNAGFLLNSRGTTIVCDPLLVGFDMPVLVDPPILPADVPAFDAVLDTHIDNDHFARQCLSELGGKYGALHATNYVAQAAHEEEGVACASGHGIGESFEVGCVTCALTPTWHSWQQHMTSEKYQVRTWSVGSTAATGLTPPTGASGCLATAARCRSSLSLTQRPT